MWSAENDTRLVPGHVEKGSAENTGLSFGSGLVARSDEAAGKDVIMRVLISGGGIAGLTLAYWLQKSDIPAVVIEQAQAMRRDGYEIDFVGTGYDVASRMGLIDQLAAQEQAPHQVLAACPRRTNESDQPSPGCLPDAVSAACSVRVTVKLGRRTGPHGKAQLSQRISLGVRSFVNVARTIIGCAV